MTFLFIETIQYCLFSFLTYFTTFPKNLFIQANKNSNLGLTGIGIGLINNQRIFWISNVGLIIIFYHSNSQINKMFVSLSYISIQFFLFYKTTYWYKVLKEILYK